jgi:hypothetical protein
LSFDNVSAAISTSWLALSFSSPDEGEYLDDDDNDSKQTDETNQTEQIYICSRCRVLNATGYVGISRIVGG